MFAQAQKQKVSAVGLGVSFVSPLFGLAYVTMPSTDPLGAWGRPVGRLGRSFAQFRVLPFTHGMHSMVEDKHASLPYNNVNLVTYCGADVCAQTARVGWNAMAASPSCSVPSRAPQTIGLF